MIQGKGFSFYHESRGQDWFQWVRYGFFIANPLTNARNGPMRFESGSRLFGNRIFEHPRPRNEPGKTKPRSPGIRNDGRSSRNSLESILRPKTPFKNSKKTENPRKPWKSHYLAIANPVLSSYAHAYSATANRGDALMMESSQIFCVL